MESKTNYFFDVAYSLYVDGEDGKAELIEKTNNDNSYKFISGLGFTLDFFEKQLINLEQNDTFNFIIPVEEAYGEYVQEHILELSKDLFIRNGIFDTDVIYPGAVLPMMNEDGNHLQGIVKEVRHNVVIMDFNHPLAGKALHFKGKILSKRLATNEEIQKALNFTQESCCGGHCQGGCHNECDNKSNEQCGCGNCCDHR